MDKGLWMLNFEIYREKLIKYAQDNLLNWAVLASDMGISTKTLLKIRRGDIENSKKHTLRKFKEYVDYLERHKKC
jgi:hypothetical protein